jgi:hypothetical protein
MSRVVLELLRCNVVSAYAPNPAFAFTKFALAARSAVSRVEGWDDV